MARDLRAFLIPGLEVARAHGLDLEAAGLRLVASPRHASVLVLIGPVPAELRDAGSVVYAQMARPRALLVLGEDRPSPLPAADVVTALSQQGLLDGVRQLRNAFANSAFDPNAAAFDAPLLQVRIEYTCSMHPEVVQDEPGSCPKCGMTLQPREAAASHDEHHAGHASEAEYTCPMHPEIVQSAPGSCPKCGMTLQPREAAASHDEHHAGHASEAEYTCPMHPEVVQSAPGSCPKCGMTLQPREVAASHDEHHAGMDDAGMDDAGMDDAGMDHAGMDHAGMDHAGMDHAGMDHAGMNHGAMGFMSMKDVTKDLPRSKDGLPMEWIEVPFGPFFPGLPGGLMLTLTLDGDTVAGVTARSLVNVEELPDNMFPDSAGFVEHLAEMDSLAPVSFRLLACLAIENAAQIEVSADTACARIGALERERIASHLNWLALFAQQAGFDWLLRCATSLQLGIQQADPQQIMMLSPDIEAMINRVRRTPLLKSRTVGLGLLSDNTELYGPVARASGIRVDVRSTSETYSRLGFTVVYRQEGDAFARLQVRLDEIARSLALIRSAGAIESPAIAEHGQVSASGEATIETPRGQARLRLTLEKDRVIEAQLNTPSTQHITLIEPMIDQQSLSDALLAVGSLDLSPWEVRQ